MKRLLMVAFHFPPAAMGSGHLRTLGFAKYLPASGWDPVVLSAYGMAYPRTLPIAHGTIPPGCVVRRSLAFDAGRHFAIAGKYPGLIAQPDRWASWWPSAVWSGLRLIRRHRVHAIWSTYPIMTAHWIGHTLARITGLPWIADFRDPVSGSVSTDNPFALASQQRWERRILHDATRVVLTTPGALRHYAEHYPEAFGNGRLAVIENGYDETAFADLPNPPPLTGGRPLTLLHSGLLYPNGRDPIPFLTALARLRDEGAVDPQGIRVVLRASGSESIYAREIARLRLADVVVLAPSVSNHEALMEQARSDGLLLFQGIRFDRQIPAKLYEYLRIGRPIFALLGLQGDTAAELRNVGGASLVPIDDVDAIVAKLPSFLQVLREGRNANVHPQAVVKYSRRAGAEMLASMLDKVVASPCGSPDNRPSIV